MPSPCPGDTDEQTGAGSNLSFGDSSANIPLATAAPRNFAVLALYQIVMRMGWIFKTESIMMPAVVDYISGAGWVRGCLPMLNRFGHSVPPILMARQVKLLPCKKWAVTLTTSLMSALFLLLTWLFSQGFAQRRWMPGAFLVIYAAFFMCIGINHLALNTLQGKLVRANRRGRLLLISNLLGACSAVACAFFLLPGWLQGDVARFDLIFGFAGTLFACAAVTIWFLIEPADKFKEPPAATFIHYFGDAGRLLVQDRNFRRLALLAALFGVSFMLFPHYQSLGLRTMQLDLKHLMWWVIIQNLGTGLFSIPIGSLADQRGNRLVLRIALLGVVAAPVVAVLLSHAGESGRRLYGLVFALVGLTPVVLRTLQNYTLEVTESENHPRYLSTLALCMAGPMFLSPLAGWCVDLFGFDAVFLAAAGLILASWLLTFTLQEPRHLGKLSVVEELD